jgi:putative FmdB family regulatory protein
LIPPRKTGENGSESSASRTFSQLDSIRWRRRLGWDKTPSANATLRPSSSRSRCQQGHNNPKIRVEINMPIYEYRCEKCEHEFEREQRITADPIKTCPKCKARKVKKLISQTSFVLKGGGWYNDLYSSTKKEDKSSSSDSGTEKSSGNEKKSDDKSKKADAKSGGDSKTKPDKKKSKKSAA